MNDQMHDRPDYSQLSASARIDVLCDEFGKAWVAGAQPRIEEFLRGTDESERTSLLKELLGIELELRRGNGETAAPDDYIARFPDDIEALADVFRQQPAPDTLLERKGKGHGKAESPSTVIVEPSPDTSDLRRDAGDRPQTVPMPDEVQRLGRYFIKMLLGQGGFGRVYLAYDEELDRHVAIKVPRSDRVSQPADVEAYVTEARVVAGLDHPAIVPVYDVGRTEDGLFFIVSKYIDGSNLVKEIGEHRFGHTESAELAAIVAEALHFAHTHGLVHRDVKPANILIDSNGKPYVADFGLALKEEDLEAAAYLRGTAAYMSPEQARGEGHRVDGRSDVFSLGVVFYEILTGRRPFRAQTTDQLLEQIIAAEPRPPRQIDDCIPKELERICLKALSKRTGDRYTTAKDMAEDLRHYLAENGNAQQTGEETGKAATLATAVPAKIPALALDSDQRTVKIIPKGLHAFDTDDADFFLGLLPGPRDRNGLPEGVRFWKSRIEELDPDNTFAVGLIYGPSGSGKSSFVKAGLLPRLAEHVGTVFVEATQDQTEARLLRGLHKACPDASAESDLAKTIAKIRRGEGRPDAEKVLIVIDQFEQWLHANRDEQGGELVQALRQCDGERVQCVVMVRDDFWMAISRFMRQIEVPLVEGRNCAAVDLFDRRHARKVLASFGRAYQALPERLDGFSEQQRGFLEEAVESLAADGKVIPVRLALFAEMIKSRPWTSHTLNQVGGTEGLGVTFLDETFSGSTAPPEHRMHQKAARAVLNALLPEHGTEIRGSICSREELQAASGYAKRPQDFDKLMQILDSEVRLLTPVDPETLAMDDEPASHVPGSQTHYQLTHDYLVPSLRKWLTQKQQQTRRGRAEIRLSERASLWSARPERKQLPSIWEWLRISTFTSKKDWSVPERKMMSKANRFYRFRALIVFAVVFAAGLWGFSSYRRAIENEGRRVASELRTQLLRADRSQVQGIMADMTPYRRWLLPLLRESQADPSIDARQQLNLCLALLPVDEDRQLKNLIELTFDSEPEIIPFLTQRLYFHKNKVKEPLWKEMETSSHARRRLCSAAVLALFDPENPRWDRASKDIAEQLVSNPHLTGRWIDPLRRVKDKLLEPLLTIYRDHRESRAEQRTMAAYVIRMYATDKPELLRELGLDSNEAGSK